MADSPLCCKILANNISSHPRSHVVVPFLFDPLNGQERVNRGRGKWYRQQIMNFKQKVNNKIRLYPKYLIIFTAYQLQGWCNTILIPVKDQPDGRNV